MSVMEILKEIRSYGAELVPLDDGRLKVRAPAPLPETLLVKLRSARRELLDAIFQTKADTDVAGNPIAEEWKAYFDERAAVRQFCGGIPRGVAEELAWDDTLGEWHRTHPMEFPAGQCAGCGQPIGRVQALRLFDGSSLHFDTMNCIARYGQTWRCAAGQSLKALGIEWLAVRNPRFGLK